MRATGGAGRPKALGARRLAWSLALCAVVMGIVTAKQACAETYPNRPITIVIPLAAGGAIDAVARMIQPQLQQSLGQPVIIVDRPGASGAIGANSVAKASPDGYTLLMAPSTFTVDPAVNTRLPYDVKRDFEPIVVVAENAMLLVVNAKLPAQSVAEFVSLAKSSPGKINYATPGAFSQAHLLVETWSQEAGIKLQQVPFKGAAPAVLSTIAGETQMTLASPLAVLSQVKGGALRAIATAGRVREPQLPDLPTTVELGYRDFVATQWIGLLTTAGTPPDVVRRLNGAVNEALKDKDVQARLAQQGVKTVGGTAEQFRQLIDSELANWERIARAAKIEPQ